MPQCGATACVVESGPEAPTDTTVGRTTIRVRIQYDIALSWEGNLKGNGVSGANERNGTAGVRVSERTSPSSSSTRIPASGGRRTAAAAADKEEEEEEEAPAAAADEDAAAAAADETAGASTRRHMVTR